MQLEDTVTVTWFVTYKNSSKVCKW